MKDLNFHFFSFAALGEGLSGSDRIFIELARRWAKNFPVSVYVWTEGYQMCQRQNLTGVKFVVTSMKPWDKMGFVVNYFARIILGIFKGFTLKLENKRSTIVYSSSEFWMDSLPAFILKKRYKKITWVASWYQTAPNPFTGFKEGQREKSYNLAAFFYWLVQKPIKPLIENFSDYILVNNSNEEKYFPRASRFKKTVVVLGAVDTDAVKNFIKKGGGGSKKYDAVFQGRFHPQKGVVELIDIWKLVVKKKKNAKLVMIGDGPLMSDVKKRIRELGLDKLIILTGYLFDGEKKFKIFSQSKVVLHPAFFDSGGMAASEAMAFGLPAVGFNLKSFDQYYPKGMIKVKIGDLEAFSLAVLELLQNKLSYTKVSQEASDLVESGWSWNKRAKDILGKIRNEQK